MLKGGIFIFIVLFFVSTLWSQKKYPNKGVGITLSTVYIYPFPQLHYTWLPSPKQLVTIRAGVITNLEKINYPWATFGYSRLINFNPKKRTHLLYGVNADIALGKFTYAGNHDGGIENRYYKRYFMAVSPHFGVRIKSGKRNFFTASIAAGPATLLSKITEATPTSYYRPRVFILPSLKLEYTFMFKRK